MSWSTVVVSLTVGDIVTGLAAGVVSWVVCFPIHYYIIMRSK